MRLFIDEVFAALSGNSFHSMQEEGIFLKKRKIREY